MKGNGEMFLKEEPMKLFKLSKDAGGNLNSKFLVTANCGCYKERIRNLERTIEMHGFDRDGFMIFGTMSKTTLLIMNKKDLYGVRKTWNKTF